MNESLCIVGVMGSSQCVETSCLVPPGGDSREQRDHSHLPVMRWDEEEHEQKDLSPHNIHQILRKEIV